MSRVPFSPPTTHGIQVPSGISGRQHTRLSLDEHAALHANFALIAESEAVLLMNGGTAGPRAEPSGALHAAGAGRRRLPKEARLRRVRDGGPEARARPEADCDPRGRSPDPKGALWLIQPGSRSIWEQGWSM